MPLRLAHSSSATSSCKHPIAIDLPRLLRLSGERRSEGTGQRGQQEAAAVHLLMS